MSPRARLVAAAAGSLAAGAAAYAFRDKLSKVGARQVMEHPAQPKTAELIRRIVGVDEFTIGPIKPRIRGRSLEAKAKVSICPDAGRSADTAEKKYTRLRLIYVFDNGNHNHLAWRARSTDDTKVALVTIWFERAEAQRRRKFFNRVQIDPFLKHDSQGDEHDFKTLFMNEIEQRMHVPVEHLTAVQAVERVVIGHSQGGNGALAVFAAYPEDFQSLVLLEPAFPDAAARVLLQHSEVGDDPTRFHDSQAAADDNQGASELLRKIRDGKHDVGSPYQRFHEFLTGKEEEQDDHLLERLQIPNTDLADTVQIPQRLRDEYERMKEPIGHLLSLPALGMPSEADQQRKFDAIRNRVYREKILSALKGNNRKVLMFYGDKLPRAGTNPFDWIPWQAVSWYEDMTRIPGLTAEIHMVPGNHGGMVEKALDKVFNGHTGFSAPGKWEFIAEGEPMFL